MALKQPVNIMGLISDPFYNAYTLASLGFGDATAAMAEKIMKLESGNYKSTQFQNGYSAGMVAAGKTFPYGWKTLEDYWKKKPAARPIGLYTTTVDGKSYSYLRFPTFRAALMSLCARLAQINNDPTKWNGGDDPAYATKIAAIQNDYVTA